MDLVCIQLDAFSVLLEENVAASHPIKKSIMLHSQILLKNPIKL